MVESSAMTGREQKRSDSKEQRVRLGKKLREARSYVGFTQDEVASALGIPRTSLSELEAGKRRVDVQELTRLSKLYRQPISFFLDEDKDSSELPADVMHLARQAVDLSDQDRDELQKFAAYLRGRAQLSDE
tara:strand:- start:12083 stop:12475 length:393 start_codon:yes stop_codon:yes gene_type:complete